MQAKTANRIDQLFDYLVDNREGVTWLGIARHFKWTPNITNGTIKQLREVFGDDNENLVCEPNGLRQKWLYRLTGDPEKMRWWQKNRTGDMQERLLTIRRVAQSVEKATDGRSIEGKRARKIARTLVYLEQELAEIA